MGMLPEFSRMVARELVGAVDVFRGVLSHQRLGVDELYCRIDQSGQGPWADEAKWYLVRQGEWLE